MDFDFAIMRLFPVGSENFIQFTIPVYIILNFNVDY